MNSYVYEGWVRHHRYFPRQHLFSYRLFMMYLDLSELDQVVAQSPLWSREKLNLASFYRSDYHGAKTLALDESIRQTVYAGCGIKVSGPVRMLTHLRYFGYIFNPVTFYYCYDDAGENILAIVAEITNTPWLERHTYLMPASSSRADGTFHLEKTFHISPFMDMQQEYHWRFSKPAHCLTVHMDSHQSGRLIFNAALAMRRKEITPKLLNKILIKYPFMTAKATFGIYFQALRLWAKRIPFCPHPKKTQNNINKKKKEYKHAG